MLISCEKKKKLKHSEEKLKLFGKNHFDFIKNDMDVAYILHPTTKKNVKKTSMIGFYHTTRLFK